MERTFAIVKPDGVENHNVGNVLARIEKEGFRIVGMRMIHLTRQAAEGFYAVHRERPFFNDLTTFMSSGPALVMVLERENAIRHWRETMGDTNPENADAGTLRKLYATNIERNTVHGSDAPETAAIEIDYFFRGVELV
ncbi:MAG: nucleoside-diphosphate kinase [Acidobacteriota bacterium]|nr:nucleoside-diphosphate kinase [Acidobacteriota bacterium]MDH3785321.1 nucleoside-diphosphate kinase [Acidobacteriota bacterium]